MRCKADDGLAAWQRLQSGEDSWLTHLWANPARIFQQAGMEPDRWQKDLLQSVCPEVDHLVVSENVAGHVALALHCRCHRVLHPP